jgi:cobaltochelatase CobN
MVCKKRKGRFKKISACLVLIVILLSLLTPMLNAADDSVVTSIVSNPANMTLKTEATKQIAATVKDQNGEVLDSPTITWSSDKEAVATVNEEKKADEEIKADEEKKAEEELKADEEKKADEEIKVGEEKKADEEIKVGEEKKADEEIKADEEKKVDRIELDNSTLKMAVASKKTLQATVYNQFGEVIDSPTIEWSSENEDPNKDVATVDDKGVVTAEAEGEVTITAACGGLQAKCKIKVINGYPVNLVVITGTTGFTAPMVEAYHNLFEKRNPPYEFGLKIFAPSDLESPEKVAKIQEAILNSDAILLEMIGANRDAKLRDIFSNCYTAKWKNEGKQPQIFVQRSGEKTDNQWSTTGFIVDIVKGLQVEVNKDDNDWKRINDYILNSGVSNWERLLLYLAYKDTTSEDLEPINFGGAFVYHPDAEGSGIFFQPEDYYKWYMERAEYDPNARWIGIIGYDSFFKNGDQDLYISTVKALEKRGLNAILLYSPSDKRIDSVRTFFYRDLDADGTKEPAIDTMICGGIGFQFYSKSLEQTLELFKEMNIPILTPIYSSDLEKWKTDPAGAYSESYWQIAQPELDGRIEPVMMGGTITLDIDQETGAVITKKIALPDRMERLAGRAEAWAKLHRSNNQDKKVAIIYYNLDGGKDGIGASYLNVPRSLTEILKAMKANNYLLDQDEALSTEGNITEEKVFSAMFDKGRNIGGWAPGELKKFVSQDGIIKLSVEQYLSWYNQLPANLREAVEKEWGPAPGSVMVDNGEIVLPGIISDNIFFGPQPMRGWGEDVAKITHSPVLPPTHQYLAFYFWLQYDFKADAVVHLGTHGTAEWLPGKAVGLSGEDWPDIVQGNMPNIYPYIVNNPGEGTQAKRRGNAVLIDHLTAALANTELYGSLLELHDLAHKYEFAADPDNNQPEEEAEKLLERIVTLIELEEMDQKLGLDMDTIPFTDMLDKVHEYLHGLEADVTPMGLHTFGVAPQGDAFEAMVTAIINYDPEVRSAIEDEIRANLLKTTEEMDMLLLALNAGYIPPGLGNDPVRNPDVMPTGKNIKSFDPRIVPDKVAWLIGKKCADDLLATYYAENGSYPESIGAILWAIETMRTEGQSIAMVMRLMGIEPVWDASSRVKSYKITPVAELDRPRIDVIITTSGLFRDTFNIVSELLDKAVRELAGLNENISENHIKKHYEEIKTEMISQGYSEQDADFLAASRVFGEKPGTYGTGLSERIEATESWSTRDDLVDTYLTRMGYIYGTAQDGTSVYGQPAKDALSKVLKDVQATVLVRDSVYGALDNDDVASYLGGLTLAAESVSGKDVMAYIANTRLGANRTQIQTLEQFVSQELDSRLLNPKFVEAMLQEGYAGSQTLAKWLGNTFLVDATLGAISDKTWSALANTYFYDQAVVSKLNPYALQSMIGYTLEAARKDMWQASPEDLTKLSNVYMQTMVDYGVVCCHHTCKNITMNEWLAQFSTLDDNTLKQFQATLADATQKDVNLMQNNSETTNTDKDDNKDDNSTSDNFEEEIQPPNNEVNEQPEAIKPEPPERTDTQEQTQSEATTQAQGAGAGDSIPQAATPTVVAAGNLPATPEVSPQEQVDAQQQDTAGEQEGKSQKGKAYELSEEGTQKKASGVSLWAIGGVVGVMAAVGFGVLKGKR